MISNPSYTDISHDECSHSRFLSVQAFHHHEPLESYKMYAQHTVVIQMFFILSKCFCVGALLGRYVGLV